MEEGSHHHVEDQDVDSDAHGDNRLHEWADWVAGGGNLLAIGSPGHNLGHIFEELMRLCGVRIEWKTHDVKSCWDNEQPHKHRILDKQPNGTVITLAPFVEGDIVDVRHGKGRAVFVTNSVLFSRKGMGAAFQSPTASALQVFEIEYAIAQALLSQLPLNEQKIHNAVNRFEELVRAEREQKAAMGIE